MGYGFSHVLMVQWGQASFFGLGGGYFASDQKTSFTKKFSIDPMNLNPGVETAESKICILLPGASEV